MWPTMAVCVVAVCAGPAAGRPDEDCRPPAPLAVDGHITAVEGSSATLRCQLDARHAAVSWVRAGRRQLLALTINEFRHTTADRYRLQRGRRPWPHWQLRIERVTTADTGRYRCHALYETARPAATRWMQLTVVAPNRTLVGGARRRRVRAGGRLELSCAADRAVRWRVDGGLLPADGRLSVSAEDACSRLTVQNVTAADAGVYTCAAPGLAWDSVRVDVVPAPPEVNERNAASRRPSPELAGGVFVVLAQLVATLL